MRKIVLLLLLAVASLHAIEIDEYKVDLYYANGIMMVDDKSKAEKIWKRRVNKLLTNNPNAQKHIGKIDIAYNLSDGMVADMWEAFLQKTQLENTYKIGWFAFKRFIGKLPYTRGLRWMIKASEIASKINAEIMLREQVNQYKESINSGHGVVVVAHSQGNLFTAKAFNRMGWRKPYFHTIAVASPHHEIPNGGHAISFDNDMITDVPGASQVTVPNQNRRDIVYFPRNALGEINGPRTLERDIKSVQYHGFEYYLGYPTYESILYSGSTGDDAITRTVKMQTSVARVKIEKWLLEEIDHHIKRESQWIPKTLGCTCKTKYAKMTHKFDPEGMDKYLKDYKVKDFAENEDGKIYKADAGDHAVYVRALDGDRSGDGVFTVEEIDEEGSDVCYALKDDTEKIIGEIVGLATEPKPKLGVVEITLSWDHPELDYDLDVQWDAGEVDIADSGCPMEHFHIKSEMKIYPGKYGVFIRPKDATDKVWEDPDLYPIGVDLVTRTPGASDTMHFEIKKPSDIILGHVSDIKVFRVDDEENESNSEGSDSLGNTNSSPAFLISPSIAPECPPVIHTPSSGVLQPIYFHGGNHGTWTRYGGEHYLHDDYGSLGDISLGDISFGGGSVFTPQQSPECVGDTDCLPKPEDESSSTGDAPSLTYSMPTSLEVGGRPLLPESIEESNDSCNLSCGCIPCEYEIIPYKRQVYFGPLRDANFSIYTIESYKEGISLYDGVTSGGETLYDAGEIEIEKAFQDRLEDDRLYIIEARGGEDIDVDDNFFVDSVPIVNQGKVYAVATGKDIRETGVKVNILTTLSFVLIEDTILDDNSTQQDITLNLNKIALRVLRYKVYPVQEDSNITNRDLLGWLPTVDQDVLMRSYEPLKEMVADIYDGKDIYTKAFEYVFYRDNNETNSSLPFEEQVVDDSQKPIIKSFTTHLSEDADAGVIGNIEVLRGSDDIYFGELSGKGSENFEINNQGEIALKEGVKLDYETKWLYILKAQAFNKNGGSGEVAVYISIDNVLDAPEFIGYDGLSVDENISSGDVVGQLHFKEGASPIESMELIGTSSEMFSIDSNGTIRLKEGYRLDYEEKYSYGFWAVAKNSYGSSMPVILYINVQDISDTPKILGYEGGYVSEEAKEGTVVGEVAFDKGLASTYSLSLEGEGADIFTIDTNGTITVREENRLDYECVMLYQLGVTISSSFGSHTRAIFVSVVDSKDVPSFVSFMGGNVKENAFVGTVAGKIVFDEGSMPIERISISGEGSDIFKVLEDGTIIVVKDTLNYEEKNAYLFQVIATNALGDSLPVNVHIFVDNIQETFARVERFVATDIAESLSIGSTIGQIKILDEGSSSVEAFELTGEGSEHFSVDANGTVSLSEVLDFEEKALYTLKVKAKNQAGYGEEADFIVYVHNIADTPPTIEGVEISVDENVSVGTVVGSVDVLSEGEGNITGFTLDGNGSDVFSVDDKGSIRVAGSLDYEKQNIYHLNVIAHSNLGDSNEAGVSISVNDVPDVPPVLKPFNTTFNEGMKLGDSIGTVEVEDEGDRPITKFEINGTVDFEVDDGGTISISRDICSPNRKYHFSVQAYSESGWSEPVDVNLTQRFLAHARFGYLGDANVSIYKVESNGSKTLKWQEVTTNGDTLDEVGEFFSHRCEMSDDSFYIYEVRGGVNWDADDDGKKDEKATENSTISHLILQPNIENVSSLNVTLLSEVLYEAVEKYIKYDIAQLKNKLLEYGSLLYQGDVYQFNPVVDVDELKEPYQSHWLDIKDDFLEGNVLLRSIKPDIQKIQYTYSAKTLSYVHHMVQNDSYIFASEYYRSDDGKSSQPYIEVYEKEGMQRCELVSFDSFVYDHYLTQDSRYLFALQKETLSIFSVDGCSLSRLETISLPKDDMEHLSVDKDEKRVYLTNDNGDFLVYDISDRESVSLTLEKNLDIGWIIDFDVMDDKIYYLVRNNGIELYQYMIDEDGYISYDSNLSIETLFNYAYNIEVNSNGHTVLVNDLEKIHVFDTEKDMHKVGTIPLKYIQDMKFISDDKMVFVDFSGDLYSVSKDGDSFVIHTKDRVNDNGSSLVVDNSSYYVGGSYLIKYTPKELLTGYKSIKLGDMYTEGFLWGIDIEGDQVYVSDIFKNSFNAFNMSNPLIPIWSYKSGIFENYLYDIVYKKDLIYMMSNRGIGIYNIEDINNPIVLDNTDDVKSYYLRSTNDKHYIYTYRNTTVYIYDILNYPDTIYEVSQFSVENYINSIAFSSIKQCVYSTNNSGLEIVDENGSIQIDMGKKMTTMILSPDEKTLFILDEHQNLYTASSNDVKNTLTKQVQLSGYITDMAIDSRGILYLSDFVTGVYMIDVSTMLDR